MVTEDGLHYLAELLHVVKVFGLFEVICERYQSIQKLLFVEDIEADSCRPIDRHLKDVG